MTPLKKTLLLVGGAFCISALLARPVAASTITTTFAGGNGFSGNMFDVTNLSGAPVLLTGAFDVHLDYSGSIADVSVYYRSGSYAGFESSSSGWTLLGSDSVTSNGFGVPTAIDVGSMLLIGAGQTFGLYVTTTNYVAGVSGRMIYTTGSSVYSDGVLQLTLGVGKAAPPFTESTFFDRTWNGTIEYQSAVPEPATLLLLGTGLGAVAARRRLKKRA